jgi:hypothetical protein
MIGYWGKLHNDDLHNLHALPSINRMIQSKTMRLAGHVAHKGEEECIQYFGGKARRKETTRKT